jgi:hypothetical protein
MYDDAGYQPQSYRSTAAATLTLIEKVAEEMLLFETILQLRMPNTSVMIATGDEEVIALASTALHRILLDIASVHF